MDLIEIILKDEVIIYTYDQIEEAIIFLKTLSSPMVFDLHGVLDTIDDDVILNHDISCCSYVGHQSPMRSLARQEIKNRIASKQLWFGVLVFKRHENHRHDVGTKAWYCLLVGAKVFLDDSFDHINNVKSYGIKTYHITKQQPFLKTLNKL